MIKVSDVVRSMVEGSEIISTALSEGLLNYSAYAEKIQPEIEKRTKKPVKKGTIVVALSRIAKEGLFSEDILPDVMVNNLTVRTSLVEITVAKTRANLRALREVYNQAGDSDEFITATQGINEITIICNEELLGYVLSLFKRDDVIATIPDLVALSVKFDEKYLDQPNVIYAILRTLALEKINITEIVSTYTELAFVIKEKDVQKAFETLNQVYQR